MSRSQSKGPFVSDSLFKKIQKLDESGKKDAVKTWARSCTIIPE
jgi:small subunit ribosomal protein S19